MDDRWVVLVSASRYWFNYRHLTNSLTMYKIVRENGISDDHIIFMNAYNSCDERNMNSSYFFNTVDNDKTYADNLYRNDIQIDYRNDEVTVDNFVRLLTNRFDSKKLKYFSAAKKRLLSDHRSNVLVFLSGHGGDEFFKFQDKEELSASVLAGVISDMHAKQKYRQLLLIVDTCQAETLGKYITAPNVTFISSSVRGENSYAYETDNILGVSLIDRFSYSVKRFFDLSSHRSSTRNKKIDMGVTVLNKNALSSTLETFVGFMDRRNLYSTINFKVSGGGGYLEESHSQQIGRLRGMLVKDFFADDITPDRYVVIGSVARNSSIDYVKAISGHVVGVRKTTVPTLAVSVTDCNHFEDNDTIHDEAFTATICILVLLLFLFILLH